jgi:hypothetical protein
MAVLTEEQARAKLQAARLTPEQAQAIVETIKERHPRAFGRSAATLANEPGAVPVLLEGNAGEARYQKELEYLVARAERFRRQRDLTFAAILLAGLLLFVIGVVYRFQQ